VEVVTAVMEHPGRPLGAVPDAVRTGCLGPAPAAPGRRRDARSAALHGNLALRSTRASCPPGAVHRCSLGSCLRSLRTVTAAS